MSFGAPLAASSPDAVLLAKESRPRPFSGPRRFVHPRNSLPYFVQAPPMGFKESSAPPEPCLLTEFRRSTCEKKPRMYRITRLPPAVEEQPRLLFLSNLRGSRAEYPRGDALHQTMQTSRVVGIGHRTCCQVTGPRESVAGARDIAEATAHATYTPSPKQGVHATHATSPKQERMRRRHRTPERRYLRLRATDAEALTLAARSPCHQANTPHHSPSVPTREKEGGGPRSAAVQETRPAREGEKERTGCHIFHR